MAYIEERKTKDGKTMPLLLDSKIGEAGKLSIFWHIITKDNDLASKRCLNISRAQKIPWIKPLILAIPHASIKHWRYLEGSGEIRHYIWSESIDFFQNSLCSIKLAIFVQICSKILRACVNTWSKNFAEKLPKRYFVEKPL